MNWEKEKVKSHWMSRVFSPTNIALVKYWGKRDSRLNLPTHSSISVTLDAFGSFTTVEFASSFKQDRLILNGTDESALKIIPILNQIRFLAKSDMCARVQTSNNIPTGSGLASSASGLSSVTLAAANALSVDISKEKLSTIARLGSGSACRSFWGGFVEWEAGLKDDGSDCEARQIISASHWGLKIFLVIVDQEKKEVSSREGMKHSQKTSPYFNAWIEKARNDFLEVRSAILKKDFQSLARVSERNCLHMHKTTLTANPPVVYWTGKTLEVIDKVRDWQREGMSLFFTIDAGPNVVLICEEKDADLLSQKITLVPNISVLKTQIGQGPRYL